MAEFNSRLFLITPVLRELDSFRAGLEAALEAGDVACLLLRQDTRDERAAKAAVREVTGLAQPRGTALLVEGDPRLAVHADADGVHMRGANEDLVDAVERLKPDRIVGCGGLESRDDAMTAGEGDLDYLMFGEPDQEGALPSPEFTLERVRWWAEIFNLPCVGFAQSLGEVRALAEAGAEFVALENAIWADSRGPAAAVADALAELKAGSALYVDAQA